MRQNTVLKLAFQHLRKIRKICFYTIMDHFRAHGNMPQKLSVVGVFIYRKIRKLFCLSYIVENCRRHKKIVIYCRIIF